MGIYAKKVDSCWFTWNGDNRMTKAELVKNGATLRTLTFKYDPFGRRVEKKVVNNVAANTTTWSYLYDGDDIVQIKESDATSSYTTHLTHGPGIDEPLAMVRNGVAYLYHADGLGSIVAISNNQGNIVNRYIYESFGMPTANDPTFPNAYTYTGREWDKEFGLYYYRARYYDPLEGRFISKDPIGFAGGGVNLYGYVGNQPIDWIDPLGLYRTFAVARVMGTPIGQPRYVNDPHLARASREYWALESLKSLLNGIYPWTGACTIFVPNRVDYLSEEYYEQDAYVAEEVTMREYDDETDQLLNTTQWQYDTNETATYNISYRASVETYTVDTDYQTNGYKK